MIPRRSPFGLIQEDLWPNAWYILVSCMMLNCTSRKQVEKVFPTFIKRWPTPQLFLIADDVDVEMLCKSLGFASRRTKNLKLMTERFVAGDWTHASELPGVGSYAARAWEIFCKGELGATEPNDHALKDYWHWRMDGKGRQEAQEKARNVA